MFYFNYGLDNLPYSIRTSYHKAESWSRVEHPVGLILRTLPVKATKTSFNFHLFNITSRGLPEFRMNTILYYQLSVS